MKIKQTVVGFMAQCGWQAKYVVEYPEMKVCTLTMMKYTVRAPGMPTWVINETLAHDLLRNRGYTYSGRVCRGTSAFTHKESKVEIWIQCAKVPTFHTVCANVPHCLLSVYLPREPARREYNIT